MDPKLKEILERLEKEGMSIRSASVVASSLDEKTRSIEGVFSDETPVDVWDWESGGIVKEILLSDGYEMAGQIPFLDSHNRWSVKQQLGSARNMKAENKQLVGRVYFGNTPDAEAAYSLAKDRHLTDLSIGYRPMESRNLVAGEKYTHKDGRTFEGPVRVVTRTLVKEVSLTPIGANVFAKLRSAAPGIDEILKLRKENEDLKQVIRILTIK